MRSFEKWFSDQGKQAASPEPVEPDLPEGVWTRNGAFVAECCSCGRTYELFHDPIKEGFDQDMSYCGGSPSCCP